MHSATRLFPLGVFFLLLTSGAMAYAANPGDPSARVARLQYVAGNVSIQPQGTGEWIEGSVIRELTNADNIWADNNSRAELNLGLSRIRIDSETSLTLTEVGDRSLRAMLNQGVLNLHVRRLENREIYEIDTPNVRLTIDKEGDYRIEVPSNEDSTIVTVRQGEALVMGSDKAISVHGREQVAFRASSLDHQPREAPGMDDFDKWCQARERRLDQAFSARYSLPINSSYIEGIPDIE